MTFTIVGRCKSTGRRGIAMATSSPAVGSRCSFVSHAGAVAFQAVAEPRLGAFSLRLLEQGYSPRKVIAEVTSSDDWPGKRQIGIVDAEGRSSAFTGDDNMQWAGHITGENFVAMGNLLAGPQVVEAIAEVFHENESEILEARLMRAIEAGRDAGGQEEGQTSAAILSYGDQSASRCDLRVDISEEPQSCAESSIGMNRSFPTTRSETETLMYSGSKITLSSLDSSGSMANARP